MSRVASRMLRLIALLQSRRFWSGAELAQRLGVDGRSVRRDVDRLRQLGYPVQASAGVGGGYRLAAGAALLPLVFEEDDAVAVAVALRAAASSMSGIEDIAQRVLSRLDPLLPARVRQRATALHSATATILLDEATVDAKLLGQLAEACRDHRALAFNYSRHDGQQSQRRIEPQRLVNYGRRWYLLAWDRTRQDWRTFRVDRMHAPLQIGPVGQARPLPEPPAQMVRRAVSLAPFALQVRIRLRGELAQLAAQVPAWCGVLEAESESHCLLTMGADTVEVLAGQMMTLGMPFELLDCSERPALQAVCERALEGVRGSIGSHPPR